MIPTFVIKRDGKKTRFDDSRLRKAIGKAAGNVYSSHGDSSRIADALFSKVVESIAARFNGRAPRIEEIEAVILEIARQNGAEFTLVANAYQSYRDKRAEAKKILGVMSQDSTRSTTDAALLIESDSKYTVSRWDRKKVAEQLENEADLSPELAKDVSKQVENLIIDAYQRGIRHLKTTHVRALTDMVLRKEGLEFERRQQEFLGIPKPDLVALIFSKNQENSNVASNNPEAVNLGIAETVFKPFGLDEVFSPDVKQGHLEGDMHLHDLGYIVRVYCSSHSPEYIKKYGLNKALGNLESKSAPPNSAQVLNQHIQTFLASMQANYAGALGFGFLNIFYASLLNRPVEVVHGRLNGGEIAIEKRDLEKLVEQGVVTHEASDRTKPYFEKLFEKTEMREVGQREFDQIAQNLVFAASQNAFSRGGQTLFIDFNIHTGVPAYMRNVPAIGPKGKYIVQMPDGTAKPADEVPRFTNPDDKDDSRNGDADSSQLTGELAGGKIITYGMLEPTVQKFARALLDVWRKGDKDGRPFHFPKCDLHVDDNSFKDPAQLDLIDYASQITSENGSVYFMFDRGNDAVLAQCCRLKEKVEDKSMLKHPERLRFVGFQNVTMNLARQAYKGKTLEGMLKGLDEVAELVLKAHLQKKEFIQKLLDTDGSPLRNAGIPSDDGRPYIELDKATYIMGVIGLNEAVQFLTGDQLHQSEKAYKTGLAIISHLYRKTKEFKERTGLKFTLEETPAESTTRRFGKIDWNDREFGEQARKVIKGTEENPYYTNSIHFATDAPVTLVDRIVGQSKFHDLIASGAIVHAYMGERRPNKDAIKDIVEKALRDTACSQLVFSPTYTECDECGTVMPGEKELCETEECTNHKKETLNKQTLSPVTRIVGYYSRIKHWNGSQQQIFEDRKSTAAQYAGEPGMDMNWLYNPDGHANLKVIQFAKHDCVNCNNTKDRVARKIQTMGLAGKVDFDVHYLDDPTDEQGTALAAMYGVPFDVFPTVVVAGKNDYWKKTTKYATLNPENSCKIGVCDASEKKPVARTDFIRPEEVEKEVASRLPDYGLSYAPSK